MEILTVKNASVHFGGLHAIDNVSLGINCDQITGLIGPNGAGKTTLVSAITGFVDLYRGEIKFGSKQLSGTRPDLITKWGIARTFQVPSMPGELTVREITDTAISYTKQRVKHFGFESVVDIASFCGIEAFLDISCGSLTLPQLKRVEIARALACGPRLLLLDEAMAGLGISDIQDIIALVRDIHQLGAGVVMIEHVMSVIRSLCDEVFVLCEGKVLSHGSPETVLQAPEVQRAYLGEDIDLDDI